MASGRAGWQDPVMQRGDDLNFLGEGSSDPIGPGIWFRRTYRSPFTTSSVSISTTAYTDVDLKNRGTARSCWVFRWSNYHLLSLVSLCGEQLRVNHYVKSYWLRDQQTEYLTFKEADLRYSRSVPSTGTREVIHALILLAGTTIWYSYTATRRSQLICYSPTLYNNEKSMVFPPPKSWKTHAPCLKSSSIITRIASVWFGIQITYVRPNPFSKLTHMSSSNNIQKQQMREIASTCLVTKSSDEREISQDAA